MKDYNFKYLGNLNIKNIKKNVLDIPEEEWNKFEFRQKTYEVHKNTRTIPIIFDIDSRSTNPTYLSNSELYKEELNYLKNLFLNKLGNGFIIRAILVKLKNNSLINPHIDSGHSLSISNRMHIPVITNEKVFFQVGDEIKIFKEGEIWEINNTGKLHSVENNSNEDRVHLIIDWTKYDRLQ
jgi:aspartyl/asparaginyl beta-hydroxylase (cupin superfamily)